MITIKQVNNNKKGMKDFIDLPYSLYSNDKNWCPPLKIERKRFFSNKNPFMLHSKIAYFVAYKGSNPAGRVTSHIDYGYNSYYNTRQGFFGFFESIESLEVAEKLMHSAENWIKSSGIDSIIGPFNFSTNHEIGFLIKGFEMPPVMMMPYTKKYYPALFYNLGYQKEKELIAYWLGDVTGVPGIVAKSAEKIHKKFGDSIKIRNIDMKNLNSDLSIVLDIYNEAWSKNWGFVPMTDEEITEMVKELKFIANPDVTFILYKSGQPAAFLIALPDINQVLMKIKKGKLFPSGMFKLLFLRKKIDTIRVNLMGVKNKYRKLGLDFLVINRVFKDGLKKTHYRNVEMSWILEDNTLMNRIFKRLSANPYKRYIVMKKKLEK